MNSPDEPTPRPPFPQPRPNRKVDDGHEARIARAFYASLFILLAMRDG